MFGKVGQQAQTSYSKALENERASSLILDQVVHCVGSS